MNWLVTAAQIALIVSDRGAIAWHVVMPAIPTAPLPLRQCFCAGHPTVLLLPSFCIHLPWSARGMRMWGWLSSSITTATLYGGRAG